MREGSSNAGAYVKYSPTALYPIAPHGVGTEEVESLYSYLLRLSSEHSVPPRVLLERLASLPAWTELRHSLGRYWDSRHGADLVGVCNVSRRWAALLSAATGVKTLSECTLVGISRFICGIGLITSKPRVCLQCLDDDIKGGGMPYERLWWRVSAANCCPRHQCHLVEPKCAAAELPTKVCIPKRSGVCSSCGSVGHKCHADMPTGTPTPGELWIAQQVRQMVATLPALSQADHRHMKDELSHYCSVGSGRACVARRANMAKSQMSYWLRSPDAKTSLAQLLDIAMVEQFDLVQLMLGNLTKEPVPGKREPRRVKRLSQRVDHQALHWRLKAAVAQGKNIAAVALEAGVDISTLAKHEDEYLQLREITQDKLDASDTERRKKAVEEAETVLEILVTEGCTPSLRAASELTGSKWYPSQLRAQSLAMLRWKLGDLRVTIPRRMAVSSHEYRVMLEASNQRLRGKLGLPAKDRLFGQTQP